MKVSIIIPTYNRLDLTDRAINSVLSQSYSDFEIIVVDDASNDGSYDILREKYSSISKVFFLQNGSNLGPVFARNKGIEFSSGEILSFLDSDDYWIDFNKLSDDVSQIKEGFGIVHSQAVICKLNKKIVTVPDFYHYSPLIKPFHFSTVSILKELVYKNGGILPEWNGAEDYEFILRLGIYTNIFYRKKFTVFGTICRDSFSNKMRIKSNILCLKLVFFYRNHYPLFLIGLFFHIYLLINSCRKVLIRKMFFNFLSGQNLQK